jgi:hypothetical protein
LDSTHHQSLSHAHQNSPNFESVKNALRFELIKARLSRPVSNIAKPAGQFCAATGQRSAKQKKSYVRGPESPRYSFSVYGEVSGKSPNRKEWVEKADKKVIKPLGPKRVKRVLPLTRISQQLPMKLPVLQTDSIS